MRSPGYLVGEDPLAPGLLQGIELEVERLIFSGDAGITDPHGNPPSSFSKPIVPVHLRESDFESGLREAERPGLVSVAPTHGVFSETFVCENPGASVPGGDRRAHRVPQRRGTRAARQLPHSGRSRRHRDLLHSLPLGPQADLPDDIVRQPPGVRPPTRRAPLPGLLPRRPEHRPRGGRRLRGAATRRCPERVARYGRRGQTRTEHLRQIRRTSASASPRPETWLNWKTGSRTAPWSTTDPPCSCGWPASTCSASGSSGRGLLTWTASSPRPDGGPSRRPTDGWLRS